MNIIRGPIPGIFIIEPKVFEDKRGYFYESYNERIFQEKTGVKTNFVQDNQSKSTYGVLRGLHFQNNPYAQSKFIRVLSGEIFDVVVDIRKGSPTFGNNFSLVLSGENKTQIFVPAGFAHGFLVISETAVIHYKTDNFYHPESESGIKFNDPAIGINWPIPENEIILSEKDANLKTLEQIDYKFTFDQ